MTIDQFITTYLAPMRGRFEILEDGCIRHKDIVDTGGDACCPGCAPCDRDLGRDNSFPFGWLPMFERPSNVDEDRFIDAADKNAQHDPALRARILEVLGLEERKP